MHFTLRTSLYALHSMRFTPLHSMLFTLCTSLYVLHSMLLGQRAPHGRTLRDAFGKTQKHYGFRTATLRKPAEGLRLHVKKRKNTTALAPRQRRNPQRGYVCMSQNAKTRRFWHRANAETRRGLSADLKKRKKTTVLAPRPRRNPQRVAIPIGDVNPARRLRKNNFNLEI